MQLRILHVSDLHERGPGEKEPWKQKAVLGKYWSKNLEEICGDGGIDLVCVTGDIGYSGKDLEYKAATPLFLRLLEALKLEPERLFLVPGNHDVDRSVNKEAYRHLRQYLDGDVERRQPRVARWIASADQSLDSLPARLPHDILDRQASYRNWIKGTLGLSQLVPRDRLLGYRVPLNLPGTPPIHMIGLNTAWLSGDDDGNGVKLFLTENQLGELSTAEGEPLSGIKIVLMHHPFDDLIDGAEAKRLMANWGIDLVLRGHLHRTESSHYLIDSTRGFAEFAVSSLYDSDLKDRYRNGCQVITIKVTDSSELRGELHFRSWSSGAGWYDDNSLYENTDRGRLQWIARGTGYPPTPLPASIHPAASMKGNGIADYLRALRRYVSREGLNLSIDMPDRIYVPPPASRIEAEGEVPVSSADELAHFWAGHRRRTLLYGDYGMGKTHFALRAIIQQVDAFHIPGPIIPVYFPLKSFKPEALSTWPRKDFLDQVWESMVSHGFPPLTDVDVDQMPERYQDRSRTAFIALIQRGVFGFILDGLDELRIGRNTSWQSVLEPLLSIPEVSCLLTSRSAYAANAARELDGWHIYRLQPWGNEQWSRYAGLFEAQLEADKKHFLGADETSENVSGVDALKKLIDSRRQLRELTSRPLWCYMIVKVRRSLRQYSDIGIADLYQLFIDEQIPRVVRSEVQWQYLTASEKLRVMERFAEACAEMGTAKMSEADVETMLNTMFLEYGSPSLKQFLHKEVKAYSFLNCDAHGEYSFGHASFCDYFLAASAAHTLLAEVSRYQKIGIDKPRLAREDFLQRAELSNDQLDFLAGLLAAGPALDSLARIWNIPITPVPVTPANFGVTIGNLIRGLLATSGATATLRRNLFLAYARVLRKSGAATQNNISRLNLSSVQLPGEDLSGFHFEAVDFTEANLTEVVFRGCSFRCCTFTGAIIDGADLTNADLADIDLSDVAVPVILPFFSDARNLERFGMP